MERDASGDPETGVIATRLHSAAIHLLRRVARRDAESGLSAARLSALSVIVFGGPVSITDLATAERVRVATVSRLVSALEWEGLVQRATDESDRRVVRVVATPRGRQVLREARRRRVQDLARWVDTLSPEDREALARAADILEGLLGGPAPEDERE